MRINRGTFAGLSAGVCLILLMGTGSVAAQTGPLLSGTYTLKFHRYCQPFFSGAMNGDAVDNDISYTGFNFPGSVKDQIGVVTFNAKQKSLTGSMIQISGSVSAQDLSALGVSVPGTAFSTSTKTLSGTYSTTSNTFTVTSPDGTTTFQAVFGVITNNIAHVGLFATTFNDSGGNSCVESGELQFK